MTIFCDARTADVLVEIARIGESKGEDINPVVVLGTDP